MADSNTNNSDSNTDSDSNTNNSDSNTNSTTSYNLGSFYKDPLSEILGQLSFEELLNNYTINKHWHSVVKPLILAKINNKILYNYNLRELHKLGKKYQFIDKFIILEIFRRLNHNYLKEIWQKFPRAAWDYARLSANPNITMQDVLDNSNLPWDYIKLSSNTSISMQDVLDNPSLPWDYTELSANANITAQDVLTHPEIAWPSYLQFNPNITPYDLGATNEGVIFGLGSNANITMYDIISNPNSFLVSLKLSENPNITMKDIVANPQIKWDYNVLSKQGNITLQDVLKYNKLAWSYKNLSQNRNITVEDILATPDLPWSDSLKQINVNFMIKDIFNRIGASTGDVLSSLNPNLTLQDILKHLNKNWLFTNLSSNQFSKSPDYIFLAHRIIHDLLSDDLVNISINGQNSMLSATTIYGLIVGLGDKLSENVIKLFDYQLDLASAKIFAEPIINTKYLVYVNHKPYHFTNRDFLTGLKSAGYNIDKIYDKDNNYSEIIVN